MWVRGHNLAMSGNTIGDVRFGRDLQDRGGGDRHA